MGFSLAAGLNGSWAILCPPKDRYASAKRRLRDRKKTKKDKKKGRGPFVEIVRIPLPLPFATGGGRMPPLRRCSSSLSHLSSPPPPSPSESGRGDTRGPHRAGGRGS